VINFLYKDHQNLPNVVIDQKVALTEDQGQKKDWRDKLKELKEQCAAGLLTEEQKAKVCPIISNSDMVL
jgi:hypothetical protein